MIWHWAVARLLLVLWEHDIEVIRHAHDLSTDDEVRFSGLLVVSVGNSSEGGVSDDALTHPVGQHSGGILP